MSKTKKMPKCLEAECDVRCDARDEREEIERSMAWAQLDSLIRGFDDFELAEAGRKVAEEMGTRMFALKNGKAPF